MGIPAGHVLPEIRLHLLVKNELGITIDPAALRIFIRAHWDEVQGLAHDIHGTKVVRSGAAGSRAERGE